MRSSTRTQTARQATASPLQQSKTGESVSIDNCFGRLEAKIDAQKDSIIEQLSACMRESEGRVILRLGELTADLANLKLKMKLIEERVAKAEVESAPLQQLCSDVQFLKAQQQAAKNVVERVNKAERECGQVNELRTEVQMLRAQLDDCQNALSSPDLILRGIPQTDNENLRETFSQLCCAIQLDVPPVCAIFYLPSKNKQNKNIAAPVVVKLRSSADRSLLFRAAARFRKSVQRSILLRDIGHDSDGRVDIHEGLTKHRRDIMQSAMQLKRQKQILSVFSIRGNVRVHPNSNAVQVSSNEVLHRIAATVS